MKRVGLVVVVMVLVAGLLTEAWAATCRVGCPCGNACISCADRCNLGGGGSHNSVFFTPAQSPGSRSQSMTSNAGPEPQEHEADRRGRR